MINVQAFTLNPFQQNTYIVWNESREAFIIDPGCYNADEQRTLDAFITANNLQIKALLLTHCHIDHVFGLQWAAEKYGFLPVAHEKEKVVFEFAETASQMYGVLYTPYTGKFTSINEGDELFLGDEKFVVITAPGHSPGSICFYNEKNGLLLSGDVLFRESIGRTDLPLGSYEELSNAIEKKLYLLPDKTKVFPGHGGETTIGHEKKFNPFVRIVD